MHATINVQSGTYVSAVFYQKITLHISQLKLPSKRPPGKEGSVSIPGIVN
jgi:hypothetical protein